MELAYFSGPLFSNFLTIETFSWHYLLLEKIFLELFQFAQFWNRFGSVFHHTGDFNGISLSLGHCIFKFLEYKDILSDWYTFRRSFVAVLAERNNSLGTIWFENCFFSFFANCPILNRFDCVFHNTEICMELACVSGTVCSNFFTKDAFHWHCGQKNDSLDISRFESGFLSFIPICAILKYFWLRLPQ